MTAAGRVRQHVPPPNLRRKGQKRTEFAERLERREPELLLARLCERDDGAQDGDGRDLLPVEVRTGVRDEDAHEAERVLLLEVVLRVAREGAEGRSGRSDMRESSCEVCDAPDEEEWQVSLVKVDDVGGVDDQVAEEAVDGSADFLARRLRQAGHDAVRVRVQPFAHCTS